MKAAAIVVLAMSIAAHGHALAQGAGTTLEKPDTVTAVMVEAKAGARQQIKGTVLVYNHHNRDVRDPLVTCTFTGREGSQPLTLSAELKGDIVSAGHRTFSDVAFGRTLIERAAASCQVARAEAFGPARQIAAVTQALPAAAGGWQSGGALAFLAILGGFMIYLLPTWIALMRGHGSAGGIIAVNVLLGWTFLGWVISLAWSLSALPSTSRTA